MTNFLEELANLMEKHEISMVEAIVESVGSIYIYFDDTEIPNFSTPEELRRLHG